MRKVYRVYNWFSTGRDMLDIIHVGVPFLLAMPVVGGLFGFLANGLLGAVVGAAIVSAVVILVVVVFSIIVMRRLPIRLIITPDPVNGEAFVRVSGSWESPVMSGWVSGQITANNFGDRDLRITGLRAEFRRLIWGVWPETVYVIGYWTPSEPYTEVDWLLPAAGKPETRSVMFSGQELGGKKAKPDNILDVRIVAEVGSPERRIYIEFPERAEVRPPYVSGGR